MSVFHVLLNPYSKIAYAILMHRGRLRHFTQRTIERSIINCFTKLTHPSIDYG